MLPEEGAEIQNQLDTTIRKNPLRRRGFLLIATLEQPKTLHVFRQRRRRLKFTIKHANRFYFTFIFASAGAAQFWQGQMKNGKRQDGKGEIRRDEALSLNAHRLPFSVTWRRRATLINE